MTTRKHPENWIIPALGVLALASLAHAGNVAGAVKYAGAASAPKKIEVSKDHEVCGKMPKVLEDLLVGANKGVRNVVVSVQGVAGAKAPTAKATLDQNGCHFSPHVTVVGVGAPLEILNNDGILHNIHTFSTANPAFNEAQPKFKKVMTKTFAKPEMFKLACDAHNWMSGWMVVTDTPYYAVSDEQGNFTIKDVPAGTYTVQYWHEKLGKQTKQVTVAASGEVRADLEFPAQ
jgi:plastocyanin